MDLSVGRLLTLLELLQVYRQLTAAEIARRLEVSPRTVRRYITGLQEMGIPVEADRGPAGGYRLRRGAKLPPLMLTNEEALVIVVGLLAAQRLGLSATGSEIQGALAKVDRLLPDTQREQIQAMQDFVSLSLAPVGRDEASAETIIRLGSSARDQTAARIAYRARTGDLTTRLVDPYGVTFQGGHWYLVSWDHLRSAMRTFRIDRILSVEETTRAFTKPEHFDVVGHMQQTLAETIYGYPCEAVLDLSLDEARHRISPIDGTLTPVDGGTLLRFGADDLDFAAGYLAHLECDFVVLNPPELRVALSRMAKRLQASARRPKRVSVTPVGGERPKA